MYNLYDMGSRTLIDCSANERDIIMTLNDEIKDYILYNQKINFLVLTYVNQEPMYFFINSFEDFINYVENYRNRLQKDTNKKIRK